MTYFLNLLKSWNNKKMNTINYERILNDMQRLTDDIFELDNKLVGEKIELNDKMLKLNDELSRISDKQQVLFKMKKSLTTELWIGEING